MKTLLPIALIAMTATTHADANWRAKLKSQLPLLGHRNWIVVADSAYPWQTAPGIETVETGMDQLEVLKVVLSEMSKVKHVRSIIYLDKELAYVNEKDAKGIDAYRSGLKKALGKHATQSLLHENIISKLDDAGKTFHVLLLKTKLTVPYTSVFLQLDCGYWSAANEKKMRAAMAKGK